MRERNIANCFMLWHVFSKGMHNISTRQGLAIVEKSISQNVMEAGLFACMHTLI